MQGPAFGQADLTNCERELIHLAGQVQPQGALLVLRDDATLTIVQASANGAQLLGVDSARLLGAPLQLLGAGVVEQVRHHAPAVEGARVHFMAELALEGAAPRRLDAVLHRPPGGGWVLELEPPEQADDTALDGPDASQRLTDAVQRFTAAATVPTLADTAAQVLRELTGYDRVMVYRFDPDGHGQVIAEARDARLAPLLGHHYPASDIPQRARALYLKNRVRVLNHVDDVQQALVPPVRADTGEPLDMSYSVLRSLSPLHLQYLRNMGVAATFTASLVREGRLWGLVAAHHHGRRRLRPGARAGIELLGEVASTRLAAIEHYAHAQVALMVRRLEQRLIEATSTEGDWRLALLRHPPTLLHPLGATGAALFHEDEVLTTGEVPSTPELRALLDWVRQQPPDADGDSSFACSAVGKLHPPLAPLAPTACGVLAVPLSTTRPDMLMWFRKEQLHTITWAGDPAKPMEGDDPLQLSPRRSFEAWSEVVRGTAPPWTHAERVMARAIGGALVDIIVQVQAVRLLIAEQQLAQIRRTVGAAGEPVLLADADGALLFANAAVLALRGDVGQELVPGRPLAGLFGDLPRVSRVLQELGHQPWRGEWALLPAAAGGAALPVAVRAERVPGRDGRPLGIIVTLTDLRELRRTAEARRQLEASLAAVSGDVADGHVTDAVIGAILTNASLAAMDIADSSGGPPVAPVLAELEDQARRATALYAQLRRLRDAG